VTAVTRDDPEVPPDPCGWLALDEQLRVQLVEKHRRASRADAPGARLHAASRTPSRIRSPKGSSNGAMRMTGCVAATIRRRLADDSGVERMARAAGPAL
jgi:hypothetical protein